MTKSSLAHTVRVEALTPFCYPGSMSGRKRLLFICLAILIITAFAIHAVESSHHHPDALFGHGVSASFHTAELKWWMAIFITFLFGFSLSFARTAAKHIKKEHISLHFLTERCSESAFVSLYDPLKQALARGRIHMCVYG